MINYDMKGIGFLKEKKAILNNWTIKKKSIEGVNLDSTGRLMQGSK